MANETFTITETIVHRPGADTDGDGVIDPGEVVRTTVTIANNSTTDVATGLEFTQILAGMTIFDQPGLADINVSPIAAPDSYNVIGNTTFVVSAADGILNGATAVHFTASADMEFFGATIGANTATQTHIVTTGVIATTGAGSVSLGADGGFTYTPDAGFTGTDTFTYTLTDAGLDGNFATLGDNLTSTGTVSFIVEDLVWFIDNSAGVNGDGTQASPFNSIANFNAVNNGAVQANPGTGDYIYLREGTGTYSTADGITLLNSQILIGQGENLVINHSGQGNMPIESGSAADTPVILVTGAGEGIQLAQNNTISGLDVGMNNAGAFGIRDNGGTVGTLTISNVGVGVGNSTGQAIELDNGGTLNVLLESVTSSGAAAGIDISGVAGTGNHFTVSGLTTVNDATGFGVLISSSSVNATFSGEVTVLNDAVGADGSGINLSANTGTYNFNGGVDVTVNGPGVTGLNFQSSNVVNILDPSGTNQITSNNGIAIFVNPTTVNATLNSVTSSGGSTGISLSGMSGSLTIATVDIDGQTGNGIDVTNSAGSLTINGGTIGFSNDPGGAGVDINGGTGAVSIAASITKTSAGNVVDVGSHSTGAVTFSGPISATGNVDNGIALTNNTGGTIGFSGNVTLSTGASNALTFTNTAGTGAAVTLNGGNLNIDTTTGRGINATSSTLGAGSLTISGANNTVDHTGASGRAINIDDVTANVTLLSVNAAATNSTAIWLNNTGGSGNFTVTGTGSTAASGGTLNGVTGGDNDTQTGIGVYLDNVSNVSLSNMNFAGTYQNFGILGVNVINFTLRDSTMNGTYGTNVGLQEDAIRFGTQSSASNGLTGTALFEGNNISGGIFDNVGIFNNAAGTLNLTFQDSANDSAVIGHNSNTGSDGIIVETRLGAVANIVVNGVSFTGARGDMFQSSTQGTATSNVTLTNNTFNNSHPLITAGGGGIAISGGTDPSNYTITYNISNNTFQGSKGAEIFVSLVGSTGAVSGVIANNVIGTNNANNPVSDGTGTRIGENGNAIDIRLEKFAGAGTLTHAVRIEGNTITDFAASGIYIRSNNQSGGTGRTEATIKNNVIEEVGDVSNGGISVIAGGATGTDLGLLGLVLTGNSVKQDNSSGLDGDNNAVIVDQISSSSVIYVPGVGGPIPNHGETRPPPGGTASAELSNFWDNTNTFSNGDFPNAPGVFVDATQVRVLTNGAFVLTVPMMLGATGNQGWEIENPLPTPVVQEPAGDGGTGGGSISPTPDPTPGPVTGDPVEPAGDPAPAPAPHPVIVDDGLLSQAELDYFADAAAAIWTATGLTAGQAAALDSLTFTVADMASLTLGSYRPGLVTLDNDGGGYGWFLDGTPLDDAEFAGGAGTRLTAAPGSAPAGDFDLLTTLLHEMGHALGIDDTYGAAGRDNLMYGYLFTGERRLPGEGQADGAVAGSITSEEFAGSPIVVNSGNSSTGAFVLPVGTGVTIQWDATIDLQSNGPIVNPSNQGMVSATNATGFPDTLTDDPSVGGASDPTVTALDALILGGTVWNDNGAGGTAGNGLKEGTEPGIDGVLVTLFADTGNTAGVWDALDTQIGLTQQTTGGGDYNFTGLAPGEYIVRIDADNFDSGGNESLLNRFSSAGSPDPDTGDPDIDDDDNGAPIGAAVYSGAITLAYNSEPTAFMANDTNTTLDFGFVTPNQPPTSSDLLNDIATWTEGDATILLDTGTGVTILDADSPDFDGGELTVALSGATVGAEDQLLITNNGGVTFTANTVSVGINQIATYTGGGIGGGDLVFSFDADATPATVATLIQAIGFTNSGGDDPTDGDRTITWTLIDGDGDANGGEDTLTITSTLDVDPVNDAPALSDANVVMTAQSEDDPAPVGAVGTLVSSLVDLDTLVGGLDNVTDPDSAAIGIAVVATNETDGTLHYSIDGGANWQAVGAVTGASALLLGPNDRLYFQPDPAFDGTIPDAITLRAWDASAGAAGTFVDTTTNGGATAFSTATDTASLTVSPGNLNPVLGVTDTLGYAENDPATVIAPATTLTDDSADFDTGTVTASFGATGTPDDQLAIRNEGNGAGQIGVSGVNITYGPDAIGTFAGGVNGADLVITLSGSAATPAAVEALLRNITFANISEDPVTVARTVTFTVTDGDGGSSTDAAQVNVTASDDLGVANDDAFTITEAGTIAGQNLFDPHGSGADADPDSTLTIVSVNGGGTGAIPMASGALLTVNSDGSFGYNPNGAFDETPTSGSGAINQPAVETFTYTLSDGDTATVTITINGLDTDDDLIGTAGIDTLTGGGGNDRYFVTAGDAVVEAAAGGSDTVITDVSYTLGAGQEIELLRTYGSVTTVAVDLTGNGLDNVVVGNNAANTIDGKAGADTMYGYGADDRYFVDNVGDIVGEAASGGSDTVITKTSYTLAAGQEVELLRTYGSLTTVAIDLTGNEFANTIVGNSVANVINGKAGADVMWGYGGGDTYFVDNGLDTVTEAVGGGSDTIIANVSYTLAAGQEVELLRTYGSATTDVVDLTGNAFANTIVGNNAANQLDGKGGADAMYGYAGADIFSFTTALGGGNIDTIGDFEVGVDKIRIENFYFTGLVAGGPLPAEAFRTGSAAEDDSDRIIYNSATGALLFDVDGVGGVAAVQFATIDTGLALTASDFTVI